MKKKVIIFAFLTIYFFEASGVKFSQQQIKNLFQEIDATGLHRALKACDAERVKEILLSPDNKKLLQAMATKTNEGVFLYTILLPKQNDLLKQYSREIACRGLLAFSLCTTGVLKEFFFPDITGYDAILGKMLCGAGVMAFIDLHTSFKRTIGELYKYKAYYVKSNSQQLCDFFTSGEVQGILKQLEGKKEV